MIHNVKECLDKARRNLEAEAADTRLVSRSPGEDELRCVEIGPEVPEAEPLMGRSLVRNGCAQRKAQLCERIGEGRRERVRLCLAGQCGETAETR